MSNAIERDLDKAEAEILRLNQILAQLRENLMQIRDQDPVENALDPQWAARIANHALDIFGESVVNDLR